MLKLREGLHDAGLSFTSTNTNMDAAYTSYNESLGPVDKQIADLLASTITIKPTLFTADLIKTAYGKVNSGADFPVYIQEIKLFGVTHYETYVTNGHTDFHGGSRLKVTLPAKNAPIPVADVPETEKFKTELLVHQQGKTDYLTFITMCAETGIEKREISMDTMTCTYFDKAGNQILVEKIPR